MAEAAKNQLPSGYDEDFVNVVEEDLQCSICHLPVKEPVQTRCGHRFCKECLEEHLRRQGVQDQPLTCPADREGLDPDRDVFPDKATERKILSFAIKCSSEGCDWTGELRNKEEHLVSCFFKLVFCTNENCHATMQWKDLEEHVTITCPWRILECDHCSEPHPECKMQDHTVQCSKFPVACPNICGHSIPREMILNHTEDDCPLTITSCPYVKMGCETKLQRKQMETHLQSAASFHLELARVKLDNTEVKLNDTEVKLNDTEVKLNDTEAKLHETQVRLYNTEETTRKLIEKLDKLQRQFENKLGEDQGFATEEKIVMVKKETACYPRVFVWKINDFSEILRQAKTEEKKTIESFPFYTERYGYKLKVKVHPNGHKFGKNSHLSVYIIVMKGEYDSILPWPFNKKVMFKLIDQQEDSVQRENVVMRLFPGHHPECSARPINEDNKTRGFAQFVSHEKLHSRRYLVDDTLFLQVEVGPLSG